MKKILIIIGASGHGKVVADIAVKMNHWKEILFLDDNETVKECLGFKVVGKIDEAINYKHQVDFFVAIGNNEIRERVFNYFIKLDLSLISLIHPSVILGMDVEIGKGSVLMAGVIINSSTTIGKGCIINTGSSLDHDNLVGDFVHISPGVRLAGAVRIDKKCWIGIGSTISNNISVCEECILGAGSVVVGNIKETGIYVGVPTRRI